VFLHACKLGLEGIVAKRRDKPYRSGRSGDWTKIKNMAHPAIERAMLIALSKLQAQAVNGPGPVLPHFFSACQVPYTPSLLSMPYLRLF
jgi:hypothetical protein